MVFAYWTFPYDRLRDYIVEQVEYPTGPGGVGQASGWQLEIVDLSPSWFTGVDLTGVRLVKLPEKPDEQAVDVTFEELGARISVLPLLVGTTDVSFETRVASGAIEGEVSLSEEENSLVATLDRVNLRRLQLLRAYLPLPLSGIASGQIDVTVAEDVKNTHGKVDLRIQGLRIGDGKTKLKIPGMNDGLTVEAMEAGNLALALEIEEGKADIQKLSASGKDVEVSGEGNIRLLKPVRQSRIELLLRVKILDAYRNKSDAARTLLSSVDFIPQLRAARAPGGALQWNVRGNFAGNMVAQPAGRSRGARSLLDGAKRGSRTPKTGAWKKDVKKKPKGK